MFEELASSRQLTPIEQQRISGGLGASGFGSPQVAQRVASAASRTPLLQAPTGLNWTIDSPQWRQSLQQAQLNREGGDVVGPAMQDMFGGTDAMAYDPNARDAFARDAKTGQIWRAKFDPSGNVIPGSVMKTSTKDTEFGLAAMAAMGVTGANILAAQAAMAGAGAAGAGGGSVSGSTAGALGGAGGVSGAAGSTVGGQIAAADLAAAEAAGAGLGVGAPVGAEAVSAAGGLSGAVSPGAIAGAAGIPASALSGGGGLESALGSVGNYLKSNPNLVNLGGNLLSGYLGSRAAGQASEAQLAASREANALAKYIYDTTRADYAPYREAGTQALGRIQGLLANPASITSDPGYQFGLTQGRNALERSASARGGLYSGATLKALERYGQDYGGTKLNEAYNRYAGVAGIGQQATGSTANAAQNYGTTAGQNILGAGNARASGYVGQTNAWNQAIGGALQGYQQNALLKALGLGS